MFRTRYTKHNPDHYAFVQIDEESMTRQSEADEADINTVMARFIRTGQLPSGNSKTPRYGDAIGIPYDQALIAIQNAEEAFFALPALVRREFFNDPSKMEEFLMDPANDARAVELGLKEFKKPSSDELLTEVVKNTKKDPLPKEK